MTNVAVFGAGRIGRVVAPILDGVVLNGFAELVDCHAPSSHRHPYGATVWAHPQALRPRGVPVGEAREALVQRDRRRPLERLTDLRLVEPVRRRELLGEEPGHRGLVRARMHPPEHLDG